MLKKTKLVSLMLLAGTLAVPESAFAEITPERPSVSLSQQNGKVVCVVEDSFGPVIGASVVVKGTTNGNVTDMDGKVVLENLKKGDIIQISYIGYATQEITYTGQPSIPVTLKEDTQALQEVVVVGYGTQKKENLTGAVAAVAGDVLENRPITNVGQGLQGVVPNLNVTMSKGGAPGSSSDFNIRGNNSINGGSPLVLVDNVQMDANLVNPEDIASISVLKDAASAAIYGARAAYGVILITTKKGKSEQKPQISVSASGYWQSPALRMHNINSLEYLEMRDIAAANSGMSSLITPGQLDYVKKYMDGSYKYSEYFDQSQDQSRWIYCGNTDWFNELYKTSFSQQYNVNISGGDSKTTYYGSVGFADQNGILKTADDNYKKFNATLNLSSQLTKWLQVSAKIADNYSTEDHPITNSTAGIDAYGGMLKNDLSPLMPVRFGHTGRLVYSPGAAAINDSNLGIQTSGDYIYKEEGINNYSGQNGNTNPAAVGDLGGYTKYKINDLWLTGAVKITPLEGLVINADYTYNIYSKNASEVQRTFTDYTAVAGTEALYGWTKPSYANYTTNEDYYYAFNAFAEYSKSFLENTHNFKIMAGYNQEKKSNKKYNAKRTNLIVEDIPDLDLATGEQSMSSEDTYWAINGFFFRFNYNYKQRYLLEVNGRYDGSSKFGKDNRWGCFPSVALGWRISQEEFFPKDIALNNLKFRVSWGRLGNENALGYYDFLALISTYNEMYQGYVKGNGDNAWAGSIARGLENRSLKWETTDTKNIGFDFGFFNSKLTGTLNYYYNQTEDLLITKVLPPSAGMTNPTLNVGKIRNTGFELELNWGDAIKDFDYNIGFNMSTTKNKVVELSDADQVLQGEGLKYGTEHFPTETRVGKPIGAFYLYRTDGIFQSMDEVNAHVNKDGQLLQPNAQPGDIRFKDLDGNGSIDAGDKEYCGSGIPTLEANLNLSFGYKGFDLSIVLGSAWNFKLYNGNKYFYEGMNSKSNMLKSTLNAWTPDNRNTDVPRAVYQDPNGNMKESDRFLENGDFVRLRQAQLGYTLPKSLMQKFYIEKLRFYVSGENLFTITGYDGIDPEFSRASVLNTGVDKLIYPFTRSFTVGAQLTF